MPLLETRPNSATQQRRRRRALVGVALLGIAGYVVYSAVQAIDSRVSAALDRNLAIARVAAHMVDMHFARARKALQNLAENEAARPALRHSRAYAIRPLLTETVNGTPELAFAGAYRRTGEIVAGYPARFNAPRNARSAGWFQQVESRAGGAEGAVTIQTAAQGSPQIAVVIAVGNAKQPEGYLVGFLEMESSLQFLSRLSVGGGSDVAVLDANRQTLIPSGVPLPAKGGASAQRALSGQDGALLERNSAGEDALIGYASAPRAKLAVLVVQRRSDALGGTVAVVRGTLVLTVPLALVLLLAVRQAGRLSAAQEELVDELALQNERLEAAGNARSNFLSNMSHDLLTPLTSIRLSLSGMMDPGFRWNAVAAERLYIAIEELDRITSKIRNLLEISRFESGASISQTEIADLTDIVSSAIERVRPIAGLRAIQADFPPAPLFVLCEQARIETVLLNLLENAVKYSPAEGAIEIIGEQRDGTVRVAVRDRGPGIRWGEENAIFKKFYRSRATSSKGGTGLGLAICESIITAHGGQIGAQNRPGGGAEFWFELPAAEVPE